MVADLLGYCDVSEKTLQSLLPFFHSIIILHYLCCRLNRCGLIITERSPSGIRHLLHYTQNSDVVGVHQNAGPLGVFLLGEDVNPVRISLLVMNSPNTSFGFV